VPNVPPQPALRAALAALAERDGVGALYARLQAVDPEAARAIEPNNARRIIRALEVHEVSGRPFSAQQLRQPPPDRILTLQLTLPRDEAYARIDARVDAMMAAGLLDEVRGLLARGYGWQLSSMASLGYVQLRPFFEGAAPLDACVQRLKWDTHTFARRQEQWFRRLPNRHELRADAPDLVDQALALVTAVVGVDAAE
jgi:tRNA dimethylallyltransferase